MGLAGRRQRQRIPADPRNLSWVDDASRFGLSYLSKFGWDASKGLGSSGDGIKTHLKVQQKLDMMGIGSQHQRDPDGIAWKQNRDFEALLKRLNESAEQEEGTKGHETMGIGFVCAQEKAEGNESSVTTKKKRKHEAPNDPTASADARKKRKKEKQEGFTLGGSVAPASTESSSSSKLYSDSEPTYTSRPMAHRARIRAAKRIAGKSASAIAEILGIAPSLSTSISTTAPTPPSLSSATLPTQSPILLDNLTTSTKSVADYFKEKLLARPSSSASSSVPSGSPTPGLGATRLEPVLLSGNDFELQSGDIENQAISVPPSQNPKVASQGSTGGDSNANVLTEKQRRRERKAEKRKRREAKSSQATSKSMSAVAVKEDGIRETIRRQKTREKKSYVPADQPSDDEDDTIDVA